MAQLFAVVCQKQSPRRPHDAVVNEVRGLMFHGWPVVLIGSVVLIAAPVYGDAISVLVTLVTDSLQNPYVLEKGNRFL